MNGAIEAMLNEAVAGEQVVHVFSPEWKDNLPPVSIEAELTRIGYLYEVTKGNLVIRFAAEDVVTVEVDSKEKLLITLVGWSTSGSLTQA